MEEEQKRFLGVSILVFFASPCRCFPSNLSQQIFFSQRTLSGHVKLRGLVRTKSGRVSNIFGYITKAAAIEREEAKTTEDNKKVKKWLKFIWI